ncbi:Chromosome segregation in meiosis protein 3 [Aspergillus homomorphus CBS 101889]|uniref:Chromosome segregation in meiosis protein n=1 Tax=Aspergillus homomorphus (strain CBS 101889) TaxID=1450537 RepID=A0A395I1E0_ASPHC|nr:Swi3-domain-containing protein [Aspergillus homomorphus CBS 101889]RAL13616.1 Swi3-domain-containing protein [Aspergillus homomorphus CBS 101889]
MESETGSLNALTSHDNPLFDYDAGLDAAWQQSPTDSSKKPYDEDTTAPILGVDDKIKVSKHRRLAAKLDESRLLSHSGIPKLRRTSKQRIKLKGKGHEFSDVARLLNFYQMWLDDLYPRAKFADGLAIIEKLGHSKRLQTMRREWIDEEKPEAFAAEVGKMPRLNYSSQQALNDPNAAIDTVTPIETFDTLTNPMILEDRHGTMTSDSLQASEREAHTEIPESGIGHDIPEDDELEFLLREHQHENIGG